MSDNIKRNLWEELNEKYEIYMINTIDPWIIIYNELIQYLEDNKKKPSHTSKDMAEKKLAKWVGRQKEKQKTYDKIRRSLWDDLNEKYKYYMFDINDVWNNNYEDLMQYIEINKKKPNNNAKDIFEKRLAKWADTQKQNYIKNINSMKDNIKHQKWEILNIKYKKYMCGVDELWHATYDELIQYLDINKKKPSRVSKNIFEKRLGCWMNNQKNNYMQNINSMKDIKKRGLWGEFNEKYEEYL
jgi:hypothetical protein